MIVFITVLAVFAFILPCGAAIWLSNRMPHMRAWKVALISAAIEPVVFMVPVVETVANALTMTKEECGTDGCAMNLEYSLMAIAAVLAFFFFSTLANWLIIRRKRTSVPSERDAFE